MINMVCIEFFVGFGYLVVVEVGNVDWEGVGFIEIWVVFWSRYCLVCIVFILDIILCLVVDVFFNIIFLEFGIFIIFSNMVLSFEVEVFCVLFCLNISLFFVLFLKLKFFVRYVLEL